MKVKPQVQTLSHVINKPRAMPAPTEMGTTGEEGRISESITRVVFWITVMSLAFRTPWGESCRPHGGDGILWMEFEGHPQV